MPPSVTTSRRATRRARRPYAAILAVVALLAIAALLLRGAGSKPGTSGRGDGGAGAEPATHGNGEAVDPAPGRQSDPAPSRPVAEGVRGPAPDPVSADPAPPAPAETVSPRVRRLSPEQAKLQAEYKYPTPGQAQLPDGTVLTFKVPAEGRSVKFFAQGARYECFPDGTVKVTERRRIFEDPFEEQLIGLATPGATFLPGVLLNHSEEELKAMLAREVVINDDDPDDVREKKAVVAEMKKALSEYIADGGDYVTFISEMQKVSAEEKKLRTKGVSRLYEILDADGPGKALEFLGAYNEILAESGFAPLALPKKLRDRLDEAK